MIDGDEDIYAAGTDEGEGDDGLGHVLEPKEGQAAGYKPAADAEADGDAEAGKSQTPLAEAQNQDQQQHRVPLRELLDEREARQQAKREAEDLRQRLAAFEREKQEAAKPRDPNEMFVDPAAWQQKMLQTFEQRLFATQLENNLQLASYKHGDTFAEAYKAVQGNPMLAQQMIRQPNPGEAIVSWFKSQKVLSEVGDDPASYKTRLRQQLLDDPDFQAEVVQRVRGGGTRPGSNGSQPQNVVRMPPSLNRQSRAAEATDIDDDGDESEEGIYRSADGRFQRRR
jgi:hypothetical protein